MSYSKEIEIYKAIGVRTIRWMTGQCCNACEAIDDMAVPLGQNFPGVNVPHPPAHEGCSCTINPADEELGERIGTDEDRARAKKGNHWTEQDHLDFIARQEAKAKRPPS